MVMRYLFLFLLAALIISACDTSNEVTPIAGFGNIFKSQGKTDTMNIFSVSVDPSFSTDHSDDWIIISSLDGKVLGFRQFETNTTFNIEAILAAIPDRVNVSILQINFTTTRTSYSVQSYSNIQTAKTWYIKRLIEKKRNPRGTLIINILNSPQPSLALYKVSDDFGSQSYSSSWSSAKRLNTFNYTLYEDVSKIMISVTTPENKVKYVEIRNPNPLLNYNFDYDTDFVEPEYHIQISLIPNTYVFALIHGMNDLVQNKSIQLKGLGFTEVTHLNGTDQLALGYNTGYAFYYTDIIVNMADYIYQYEKLGDAPNLVDISVSPNSVTWINDDFLNFDFSNAEEYDHIQTRWEKNQNLNGMEHVFIWYISSSSTHHPLFSEIPEEIKMEYPFLDFDFDEMRLGSLTLFKNIDGYGYEEIIDNLITNKQEDYRPYEYESISISY